MTGPDITDDDDGKGADGCGGNSDGKGAGGGSDGKGADGCGGGSDAGSGTEWLEANC